MKNKIGEKDIKRGLKFLNFDIPSDVEKKVSSLIFGAGQKRKHFMGFSKITNSFIKWAPVYLTLLLVMILGISLSKHEQNKLKLPAEIKIEYEIKEKNIKIIWVKKRGFLLRRIEK